MVANKTKRAMSSEAKAKARLGKAGRTDVRKRTRRTVQEMAASLNRVLRAGGEATPWDVACAKRAAVRHGVAGAA